VIEAVSPSLLVQRFQTLLGTGPLNEEQQREIYQTLFRDTYDVMKNPSAPFNRDKIELMRAVLLEFASILAAREIPFLVAIAPLMCTIDENPWCVDQNLEHRGQFVNEDIAAELCEEAGIRHVQLGPKFLELALNGEKLYGVDQHFSARGNLQAAQLVKDALQSYYPDFFPSRPTEGR
jgi:hypothetical protein